MNPPALAFHGLTVSLVQAHRSAMVSAVGANAGLITCGIFGSIMWWPEAELRSCVEAAGMRLSSEERVGSFTAGKESPRSAMSKVLRRYFTPSSAALAQATLERMHSSGDLQGSVGVADVMSTQHQDSEHADSRLQLTTGDQAQTILSDQETSSCRLAPPPSKALGSHAVLSNLWTDPACFANSCINYPGTHKIAPLCMMSWCHASVGSFCVAQC